MRKDKNVALHFLATVTMERKGVDLGGGQAVASRKLCKVRLANLAARATLA